MKYKVKRYEIHSENAAKPTSTPNRWILDWIKTLPPSARVLDLGCGKLRYTLPLSKQVRYVVAVDSGAQIDRVQTINRQRNTSIRTYVRKKMRNVHVFSLDQIKWRRMKFDYILVAFVRSAIPVYRIRMKVLETAKRCLKANSGKVLMTTHFANTRFRDWVKSGRAEKCRDGYVLRNRKGNSFYALIDAKKLQRYCREAKLTIIDSGVIHGEIAHVLACC